MQHRHFLDLCACLTLADLTLQMFTGMSKLTLSSWKVCCQYNVGVWVCVLSIHSLKHSGFLTD